MTRKHTEATTEPQSVAEPVTTLEPATEPVEQVAPEAPPARTLETIRAEIAAIKRAFIGTRDNRISVLEETLEAKRAEVVADRIILLEHELALVAGKP